MANCELSLCADNTICCDDDCVKCANRIYDEYVKLKKEVSITRLFIVKNGLMYELNNFYNKHNMGDVYNYKKDVHGEWLPINDDSYYCSVCNRGSLRYDFCPHCGADMRGNA